MLQPYSDTLISVPNDRLLQIAPRDLPLEMAFRLADDILRQGIQGISELITQPGLINVDFANIRNMMKVGGGSLLAIGSGTGVNRVHSALDRALHHPMLESINLDEAAGIIANFTGGPDLSFVEVMDALSYLHEETGGNAEIIPGIIIDPRMEDRAQVILVLTGIGATSVDKPKARLPIENNEPVTIIQDTSLSFHFQPVVEKVSAEPVSDAPANLDVPAFLRRRLG